VIDVSPFPHCENQQLQFPVLVISVVIACDLYLSRLHSSCSIEPAAQPTKMALHTVHNGPDSRGEMAGLSFEL
jgi:hypothetical protein